MVVGVKVTVFAPPSKVQVPFAETVVVEHGSGIGRLVKIHFVKPVPDELTVNV